VSTTGGASPRWLLPDVLYDVPGRIGLDFDLSQISAGIYGVLLVLLRPEGLFPERRHRKEHAS
jgi:hypothetical protein